MTTTITPPRVTLDLNGMLNKFIEQRLAEYVEPKSKREGRPTARVYHASLLALTSTPVQEQAAALDIDYDVLKATRSKDGVKELVREHRREFAGLVWCEMFDTAREFGGQHT